MSNKITIEAAIIELNRLKSQERMDVDRERLNSAVDRLVETARLRIKRKPVAEGSDDMDYYLCPQCKNPVGDIADLYEQNKSGRFCRKCGQAIDWGDEA